MAPISSESELSGATKLETVNEFRYLHFKGSAKVINNWVW